MNNISETAPDRRWIGPLFIAIGIIVFLFIIIGMLSSRKSTEKSSNEISHAIDAKESSIQRVSDIIVNDATGNNGKILGDINIYTNKVSKGKYDIIINFGTGDYISSSSAKRQIESTMRDIYFDLFKNLSNINSVLINGFMPLMDKYGNTKDQLVYTAKLMGKDGYKINWQQHESTIKIQIIPSLWEKIYIADIFSDQ